MNPLHPTIRSIVLLGLLIGFHDKSFGNSVETIELRNHLAEELLPRVQALLEADEVALPNGSELLIKANQGRITILREWIQKLDTPQHRLMITVVVTSHPPDESLYENQNVYESTRSVRRYDLPNRRRRGSVLQVQTLDGKPALIRSDELNAPPPTAAIALFNYTPAQAEQFLSSGFRVIPRLLHEQVVIEIEPWLQQAKPEAPQSRSAQEAHTTLRAALGTWVEIGKQSDRAPQEPSGMTAHTYNTPPREQGIYLKVDDLDRLETGAR